MSISVWEMSCSEAIHIFTSIWVYLCVRDELQWSHSYLHLDISVSLCERWVAVKPFISSPRYQCISVWEMSCSEAIHIFTSISVAQKPSWQKFIREDGRLTRLIKCWPKVRLTPQHNGIMLGCTPRDTPWNQAALDVMKRGQGLWRIRP